MQCYLYLKIGRNKARALKNRIGLKTPIRSNTITMYFRQKYINKCQHKFYYRFYCKISILFFTSTDLVSIYLYKSPYIPSLEYPQWRKCSKVFRKDLPFVYQRLTLSSIISVTIRQLDSK